MANLALKQNHEQEAEQPSQPFSVNDLTVFNSTDWQDMLNYRFQQPTLRRKLALALRHAPASILRTIESILPTDEMQGFRKHLSRWATIHEIEACQNDILEELFWELTYHQTPDLYEELVSGERLHPGIFHTLKPYIENKVVLDAGAGSGRASLECLRYGARQLHAVEPSRGLLKIFRRKIASQPELKKRLHLKVGRFEQLPLEDNSVEVAMSCSAFTRETGQGGEVGLAELVRVTKPGGKVIIIWPRTEDLDWLSQRGFQHRSFRGDDMKVLFSSMQSAELCSQRFYAKNPKVARYIHKHQKPEVPFKVLGFNPPNDFCWLTVDK